jgi:hypothetical protein
MSWLFSQALVEEYSVDTSSDGEQSALLNGNLTQQAYCVPDKMTAFSRLSRFGMTYKPLTASRGEELLTLYRADFHVKTSQPQGGGLELTESAVGCGEKWRASFTKYNPDSRSWKTHQCSLLEDLEPFLETWPQWGLMRNGECWEQQTLAQTTSETASGLLPTPLASNTKANHLRSNGRPPRSYWETPAASDGQRGGTITDKMTGQSLPQMVNTPDKWPTPTVQDSEQAGGKGCIASGKRGLSLHQATQLWPTPTVCGNYNRKGASATSGDGLATAVKTWATPVARGYRSPGLSRMERTGSKAGDPLPQQVGGQLNPTWVEWLMGWPLGWTDLKPLATDKCHSVPQQPGSFLVNNGEICL